MAKREKSTDKQAPKRNDAEQTENRAKDIGPPKDKSDKVTGGKIKFK